MEVHKSSELTIQCSSPSSVNVLHSVAGGGGSGGGGSGGGGSGDPSHLSAHIFKFSELDIGILYGQSSPPTTNPSIVYLHKLLIT